MLLYMYWKHDGNGHEHKSKACSAVSKEYNMFDNVTMNDLMIGFNNSRIQSKKAQKWSGTKYTMNRVKNGHVNADKKVDHKKREKRVKPTSYRMWDKLSGEWQELKCSERTFNKLKSMGEKVERDGSRDTFMGDIVAQYNKVG